MRQSYTDAFLHHTLRFDGSLSWVSLEPNWYLNHVLQTPSILLPRCEALVEKCYISIRCSVQRTRMTEPVVPILQMPRFLQPMDDSHEAANIAVWSSGAQALFASLWEAPVSYPWWHVPALPCHSSHSSRVPCKSISRVSVMWIRSDVQNSSH